MDFLDPKIEDYAALHSNNESELLQKVNRETHLEVLMPRMLSGHLQGRFLSLLSQIHHPKFILEIGTYTGYSALCLAEGLAEGGRLVTMDLNEELEDRVNGYFNESPFAGQLTMQVGDATELIPQLDEKIDLVFIDADKENYAKYFDLVIDKMNPGGLIIADNVLWSGKVIDGAANDDESTQGLIEYNQKIQSDPRVDNMLLPLRDGLMIARKK